MDTTITQQHAKLFPTEISVPDLQYPNYSYIITTSETLEWKLSPYNSNIIQVFHNPERSDGDLLVYVEIHPTT